MVTTIDNGYSRDALGWMGATLRASGRTPLGAGGRGLKNSLQDGHAEVSVSPFAMYTFVTSAGRLHRRPVFFHLQRLRRDPFVTSLFAGLAQHLADQGAADQVGAGDLSEAQSSLAIAYDGGAVDEAGTASDRAAFELCAAHAGLDPLDDEIAFEFGHRRDDNHHGAAERAAGVQVLAEAGEL